MRHATLSLLLIILIFPVVDLVGFADANEPFAQFINLQIEPVNGVTAEVKPGDQYSFIFKYYNGGTMQTNLYLFYVEFNVEVEGEGWNVYVSPSWSYFLPNETKIGKVSVSPSARPSNYATIHLYGKLRDIYGNWHYGNFTFQVKATQYHSFDAKTNVTFIKGKQESIYTVPIEIINYGNYEDRFYVDPVYTPPNWRMVVSQNPIILTPGQRATVNVSFEVPPEGIYVQQRTYFIMVNVRSQMSLNSRAVAVIIAVEGFHMTLGEMVAALSILPSLLILTLLGVIVHHLNNPLSYLPKPWKEEEKELAAMPPTKRKATLAQMKEEWKSAKYFMKENLSGAKSMERLERIRKAKQRQLEEKIRKEWRNSWEPLHKEWVEACNKIKREYRKLERRLKERAEKAKRKGVKVDITMPELKLPPEPAKPAMPAIPEYRIDERRAKIIEPDEIEVERLLAPLRRKQLLLKKEREAMRNMADEIIRNLQHSFSILETKIEREMEARRKVRK